MKLFKKIRFQNIYKAKRPAVLFSFNSNEETRQPIFLKHVITEKSQHTRA